MEVLKIRSEDNNNHARNPRGASMEGNGDSAHPEVGGEKNSLKNVEKGKG